MVDVTRYRSGWVLWASLLWVAGCDGPQASGNRMYVDSGGPRADTCATTMCHRAATCSDTAEGPSCACNAGYRGDGFSCDDIDECADNADNCDVNATCNNTDGSFTCTCNAPAWQGNGTTCSDADECADNTDNCSANATCINRVGSFTCECALPNDGGDTDAGDDDAGTDEPLDGGVSMMDGGTSNLMCRDIDECAENTDDCDPNATCINNNDGFTCECNRGYVPTGTSEGHGVNGCTFAYCDLTGRWAVRTELVVSWDSVRFNGAATGDPVLCSGTRVPTYSWELREFAYDGTTLNMKSKGCGSTVSPAHNLDGQKFAQYIPYSMFDAIDLRDQEVRSIPLAADDAQPNDPFVPPYEAITFGMRLPNPEDPDAWVSPSTLPPSRSCASNEPPCWEDDDRDPIAAPGYTTWSLAPTDEPVGFYTLPRVAVFNAARLGACYTIGSRTISRFNGTFDSCDRITGDIDVMTKQSNGQPALDAWIQGCKVPSVQDVSGAWVPAPDAAFDCYDPARWNTMLDCTESEVRTLNNQQLTRTVDDTSFEMVRVPDNTECPDVRAMFPAPQVERTYCECADATRPVLGCN